MNNPEKPPEPEQDFEEIVEALLQVDPSGLSGKHRRKDPDDEDDQDPPSGR